MVNEVESAGQSTNPRARAFDQAVDQTNQPANQQACQGHTHNRPTDAAAVRLNDHTLGSTVLRRAVWCKQKTNPSLHQSISQPIHARCFNKSTDQQGSNRSINKRRQQNQTTIKWQGCCSAATITYHTRGPTSGAMVYTVPQAVRILSPSVNTFTE